MLACTTNCKTNTPLRFFESSFTPRAREVIFLFISLDALQKAVYDKVDGFLVFVVGFFFSKEVNK